MNLDQLLTFRAVARIKSFWKAAETLHLTQPAVSKQVGALESELGERLFERGRTIRLTQAGELLLKYAEQINQMVQAAREEVSDLRDLGRGRLAIGASHTIATYVLPRLLETYRIRRRLPSPSRPDGRPKLRVTWPPVIWIWDWWFS